MEHPDVIHEIDALIDSYNWEGVMDGPQRIVASIKQSLRAGRKQLHFGFGNQQAEIVMFELFLQMLQHPSMSHKDWILEGLSELSYISFRNGPDTFSMKKYHILRNAVPLLQRYLRHHRASYRYYAALTLSRLVRRQPDRVMQWLLEYLRNENSFRFIFEMFSRLGDLFLPEGEIRVHPEIRNSLILHLEKRLKSKSPLMKIETGILLIYIMREKTPAHVVDTLIENWKYVDAYKESHWNILRSFEVWVYKVGQARVLDLATALLRNSSQFIVALRIWEEIGENYFEGESAVRYIAFTPNQKKLLQAVLDCKPLWRVHETPVPEWHHRSGYRMEPERLGIASSRERLGQQYHHARMISEEEFEDYYWRERANYPLKLDFRLLQVSTYSKL